jgi:tetratricopeptide (TPR) repeat protein
MIPLESLMEEIFAIVRQTPKRGQIRLSSKLLEKFRSSPGEIGNLGAQIGKEQILLSDLFRLLWEYSQIDTNTKQVQLPPTAVKSLRAYMNFLEGEGDYETALKAFNKAYKQAERVTAPKVDDETTE